MTEFKRRYNPEMEKWGQDAPRRSTPRTPPSPGGAAPVAPTAPASGGAAPRRGQTPAVQHGGGYTAPPQIRAMQLAMQKLAKTISSTIDYDSLMKGMSNPQGADKKQFTKSFGRDAFSNFMVNSYLRNSTVKGVEYDTDPTKSKMVQKAPSDLKYMFIVLDTLKRLGQEKTEQMADGNWGPRTNNALRNISAIADSIAKLGKDLGMESGTYDVNKISELHSLVPENEKDISIQEKLQRAPKIAEILNGVSTLFGEFKQQVLSNPNYAPFINEGEPLFKVGPAKEKTFQPSQAEANIYKDLQSNPMNSRYVQHPAARFSVTVPKNLIPVQYAQGNIPPFQITGGDLLTKQTFQNWINRSSVLMDLQKGNPDSWNQVVSTILDQVKSQVDQKLTAPAPEQNPLQTTR